MVRKLTRVILNVLVALSVLLCVAACVLWVRSHVAPERLLIFSWDSAGGLYTRETVTEVRSVRGLIQCRRVLSEIRGLPDLHRASGLAPLPPGQDRLDPEPDRRTALGRAGFGWAAYDDRNPFASRDGYSLTTPYWLCVAVTAVLPAINSVNAWRAFSRRRRARLARCPACGYDLRATPYRCPECGASASGSALPTGPEISN